MKLVDEFTAPKGKIILGELADNVLELMACGPSNVIVDGRDQDGLLVRWIYPGVTFHIAYVHRRFIIYDLSAYAVQKIEMEEDDVNN